MLFSARFYKEVCLWFVNSLSVVQFVCKSCVVCLQFACSLSIVCLQFFCSLFVICLQFVCSLCLHICSALSMLVDRRMINSLSWVPIRHRPPGFWLRYDPQAFKHSSFEKIHYAQACMFEIFAQSIGYLKMSAKTSSASIVNSFNM